MVDSWERYFKIVHHKGYYPMDYEKRNLIKDVVCFVAIMLCIWLVSQLVGCTTTGAPIAPIPIRYKLMLTGTIDSAAFDGIGVGSNATSHTMTIQSAIAVNYFTLQSCHRSLQFVDIIQVPWYDWSSDNKSFTWTYTEAPTIEDTGDCPLRFCAFSSTVGSPAVACGVVDFKNDKYTLPGQNICNGVNGSTTGSAFCHTQTGLIERYQFTGPVIVAPQIQPTQTGQSAYWIKDQCIGHFVDAAQTLFEYNVPDGECYVIFMEQAKPHRRAKLTVIGFDQAQYPASGTTTTN